MLKMKIPKMPKMPKMPKIPTKILTAMGSYSSGNLSAGAETVRRGVRGIFLDIFFKTYTHTVFHFFVVFFTSKKSVSDAKNENAENSENAENPHQNFDCYGVIQKWQSKKKSTRAYSP